MSQLEGVKEVSIPSVYYVIIVYDPSQTDPEAIRQHLVDLLAQP